MQFIYEKNFFHQLLRPLSWLYRGVVATRAFLYRKNILKKTRLPVKVIVVGNITLGGTGKTPLVIALVKALQIQGLKPGVITRGYRGKNKHWPVVVTEKSDPFLCGDEAVLLAKKTGVPVVAGPKRVEDAKLLLKHFSVDIIISDDGLQHYALARDIEIAVIDEMRGFGNGYCLPAGPLREPISRLKTVDRVIRNGVDIQFEITNIVSILEVTKTWIPKAGERVVAIAGIGNPDRFFTSLREKKFVFETHAFPDHHAFVQGDLAALPHDIILMTEKDAVKCKAFADARCYVVCGEVVLPDGFACVFDEDLQKRTPVGCA